jgi:hypothetical protein
MQVITRGRKMNAATVDQRVAGLAYAVCTCRVLIRYEPPESSTIIRRALGYLLETHDREARIRTGRAM